MRWFSQGSKCMEIPEWQVHEYNPNLYILRQSPCTDFEKPFIFLFFGKDKALLMDTGSRNGNLAPALRRTVKNWLTRNGRPSIPLIVVHSHPHDDHTAGDAEVQAMHDPAMPVEFVSADLEPTKHFWGIEHWPTDIGHVDLGSRVIDLVPIPGHSDVSVALYDRNTAILLAGDSLYPGRLYVRDFAAFQASTERLVRFTEGKPVAHILAITSSRRARPFWIIRSGRSINRTSMSWPFLAVRCSNLRRRWCRCMEMLGGWPCGTFLCGRLVRILWRRRR